MRKKKIVVPVTKKPPIKENIREWVKNETTQWFLNKLAQNLNTIDTVRDITAVNTDQAFARSIAITLVEEVLWDIWEAGEMTELQKRVSEEEENIVNKFKKVKDEY